MSGVIYIIGQGPQAAPGDTSSTTPLILSIGFRVTNEELYTMVSCESHISLVIVVIAVCTAEGSHLCVVQHFIRSRLYVAILRLQQHI